MSSGVFFQLFLMTSLRWIQVLVEATREKSKTTKKITEVILVNQVGMGDVTFLFSALEGK